MTVIFIHRLLQSFLLPPLNSLIIILLSMIFFKNKIKRNFGVGVGIALLYLQSTPYVAYHLNTMIAPPPMKISALSDARAIVVLGGGVNNNATEYEMNAVSNVETFSRVRYTAYLAHKAPQLPIFASGGTIDTKDSEASLMSKALKNEFKVSNKIFLEPDSKTTSENAKYTSKILLEYHIHKIALVTSASHMRRAQALFEQNGIEVIAAPTSYYYLGYYNLKILWFIPTSIAMSTTSAILHELIGYIYDVNI